jgi:hypothetical protein
MMAKHIFVWNPRRTTVYYNNFFTSRDPLDQLKDIRYRAADIIRENWILVFITQKYNTQKKDLSKTCGHQFDSKAEVFFVR